MRQKVFAMYLCAYNRHPSNLLSQTYANAYLVRLLCVFISAAHVNIVVQTHVTQILISILVCLPSIGNVIVVNVIRIYVSNAELPNYSADYHQIDNHFACDLMFLRNSKKSIQRIYDIFVDCKSGHHSVATGKGGVVS